MKELHVPIMPVCCERSLVGFFSSFHALFFHRVIKQGFEVSKFLSFSFFFSPVGMHKVIYFNCIKLGEKIRKCTRRISHRPTHKRDGADAFIPRERYPFICEPVCILATRLRGYFCRYGSKGLIEMS